MILDGVTDPYAALGVPTVINCAGPMTAVGGTRMDEQVVQAYAAASRSFCRIEDLQRAAGRVIAGVTGAESGYVTSGAAAAVTLGVAACLAGLDPAIMDRLPDARGLPDGVLIHATHRNPYDHMVRAAGARIVEFEDLEEMAAHASGPSTVAAFFHAEAEEIGPAFGPFTAVAHARGLPVVVDAAAAQPPASNLTRFIEQGADLVAFSGGKAIRGPQSTGILAGRADLIVSVALQTQDMDVTPSTWRRSDLVEQGVTLDPPGQGLGRGMKVGREDIVALLTALERYVERDHGAEAAGWYATVTYLADELDAIDGLTATVLDHNPFGPRHVPSTLVRVNPDVYGLDATQLVHRLAGHHPPVVVNDHEVDSGTLILNPESVLERERATIVQAFRRPRQHAREQRPSDN